MRNDRFTLALRLIAAAALLWQSARFAMVAARPLEQAIAYAEIAGAVLFAIPRTARAGAALLLLVFAAAGVHHLLRHEAPFFLLYLALLVISLVRNP